MGLKITGKVIFTPSVQSGGGDANLTIQNASLNGSFDVSSEAASPSGVAFNDTGSRMFVVGSSSNKVHQYNLSTGFDIQTANFSGNSKDVSGEDSIPTGVTFNPTGSLMFVSGRSNDKVYQYDLSTNFDINTAIFFFNSLSVGSEDGFPEDITFNDDGSRLFVAGRGNDSVYQYDLGTAYDVTTASFLQSFDVSSEDGSPQGVTFNSTGSRMLVVGAVTKKVYQYNLTTNFDITTATFSGVSLDISSEESFPLGVTLNSSGTRMFVVGTLSDSIHQYDL